MKPLLPALLAMALLPTAARAHAVGIEIKLDGPLVRLAAFYDDDTPAADARVTLSTGDQTVQEGTTDARGEWTFPTPSPGQYRVAVDAGNGHAGTAKLTLADPDSGDTGGVSRGDFTGPAKYLRAGLGLGLLLAGYAFYRMGRFKTPPL